MMAAGCEKLKKKTLWIGNVSPKPGQRRKSFGVQSASDSGNIHVKILDKKQIINLVPRVVSLLRAISREEDRGPWGKGCQIAFVFRRLPIAYFTLLFFNVMQIKYNKKSNSDNLGKLRTHIIAFESTRPPVASFLSCLPIKP